MTGRFLFLLWLVVPALLARQQDIQSAEGPELLTFDELVKLSDTDELQGPLAAKLDRLLTTPFWGSDAELRGALPRRPTVGGVGPVLRVASWNIERGINLDLIKLAFSDPDSFMQSAQQRGGVDDRKRDNLMRQLKRLRNADVVVLNEVDLGMKRTDYRDITRELAHALGMNYVFGVEFVEVDPLEDLGIDKVQIEDPVLAQELKQDLEPDSSRYLGLHGNAILSRYPIVAGARIIRLPVCHDWYKAEKAAISVLEKGKRLAANKVFLERIAREVRQGGRMAIVADVRIPELPGGLATVVNVHLENKCTPECRTRQMDALLSEIKEIKHPLIMAGDLNTTGFDGTPTSIRREFLLRVKNYEFWVTQALKWGTPAGLPLAALAPANYFKNYLDPTSIHLPVIGSNKESILFRHVERLRFTDMGAFDFRGEAARNLHNRSRTLANSNQRAAKGFEPTFVLKRDFGGLVGRYKLDWFFVKPSTSQSRCASKGYEFAPHFPVTMRDLNSAVPDGVSDHAPITVDLPLSNPQIRIPCGPAMFQPNGGP